MRRIVMLAGVWSPLAALFLCLTPLTGNAEAPPSLTATARQVRTAVRSAVIPVPLWDTAWWVAVQATPGAAPLAHVEYSARFRDSTGPEHITGRWDVEAADQQGFAGRVVVTCLSRPDYDRKLQVKVRVLDAAGTASGWAGVDFPVREEAATSATPVPPATTETGNERPPEVTGTVEIEVADNVTLEEVKRALDAKARAEGGYAAVGLRLVRSTTDHAVFAADVIHHLAPPATVTASAPAPAERMLGEIVLPRAYR